MPTSDAPSTRNIESTPAARTSDAECFTPISDVKTPLVRIPPCAKCGQPSMGGICLSVEPVSPHASPILWLEFYCDGDKPAPFVVHSQRLFPLWKILQLESASKMKVQRLPREEQFERVQGI